VLAGSTQSQALLCCALVLCRSHYISPQQFATNVDRIISKAKAVGVKHFLIVTPPPVCEVCKKDKPVRMRRGMAGATAWIADQVECGSSRGWVGSCGWVCMPTATQSVVQQFEQPVARLHVLSQQPLHYTHTCCCCCLSSCAETLGPGERPQPAVR
jgi:hypothetical protein